ncbi:hypothetical protein CHS0354_022371 [Potamilus streckersoni]|uniref:Metalloendopeptidase n=1 Tax=Potamilus streckersoni TaxID=2493646 RepID=A0AAE0W566_9BIVA|nr:hypothetical protein CHS0354_022371 [Potamilus streckersoni]
MRFHGAGVLSFCVLWHWCNGQRIPEDLQKYNITPPNMFGRESPTNKTMDQLIMEAMGGLKGALSLKTINGGILMELDMLLSKQQYYSLYEQPNSSTLIRSKRKAIRTPSLRWTKGEIPYRFFPGHFNRREQYMIRQVMTEWERYTCLRFREATTSDTNVIVFRDGEGCYSQLGMVGGRQVLSLSSNGCRYRGLYLHEIGHAIGLVHEHQLPNRDDYVEILTENVQPGLLDQFNRYTSQAVDQMNVPYEYSSVMHYGVTAFSKDGVLKTIHVKYPEKEASIGDVYMKELSFTDVEIVNKMYKCPAKCDPSIQCSGGYVDENCRCVCKNGSHDCQIGGRIQPSPSTCGVNTYGDSWKCFVWAQHGQFEANPAFMNKSCARACGHCGLKRKSGTCVKMYPNDKCLKWSRNGDCLTNTEWMNNYCCGTCVNSSNGTACQNKHNNAFECDRWASQGECETNPLWMIRNCQKSCRACDEPMPTQEPTTTPSPDVGCINLYNDFDCDIWAASRQCDNNPIWMLENCKKSCGQCNNNTNTILKRTRIASTTPLPSTTKSSTQRNCIDKHDAFQCQNFARAGECDKNPAWMIPNCQRSCGICSLSDGCENKHNDTVECDRRASEGECETKPLWMIPNCQRSCHACQQSIPTQAATSTTSPIIENGIQIWVIAVIAGPITALVILFTVKIVLKRRVLRNQYELPIYRDARYRQSHIYMNLDLTSLT